MFRHQPRLGCLEAQAAQVEFLIIGQRKRLVERQHDLALGHRIALLDEDAFDDPALEVLHDLVFAGRDKAALRDHGCRKRCPERP